MILLAGMGVGGRQETGRQAGLHSVPHYLCLSLSACLKQKGTFPLLIHLSTVALHPNSLAFVLSCLLCYSCSLYIIFYKSILSCLPPNIPPSSISSVLNSDKRWAWHPLLHTHHHLTAHLPQTLGQTLRHPEGRGYASLPSPFSQ